MSCANFATINLLSFLKYIRQPTTIYFYFQFSADTDGQQQVTDDMPDYMMNRVCYACCNLNTFHLLCDGELLFAVISNGSFCKSDFYSSPLCSRFQCVRPQFFILVSA